MISSGASYQSACLTFGSYFQNDGGYEQTLQNPTFTACGNSALGIPVIDASALIPINSGGWTKYSTGGAYFITVTTATAIPGGGDPEGFSAFEGSSSSTAGFLTLATSAANCDSTPGTYYIANAGEGSWPGGSGTLYVNPTAGGSPASNGLQYKYTSQVYALNTWNPNASSTVYSPTVLNISMCCQAGNNGSFVLGKGGYAHNVQANFGGKHNTLIASDTVVDGLSMTAANVALSGNYLIHYDNVAISNGSILNNITVDGTGSVGGLGTSLGYDSHQSSGTFGTILLTNWTVMGPVSSGIAGQNPWTGNSITCSSTVKECVGPFQPVSISNLISHAYSRAFTAQGGITATVSSSSLDNMILVAGSGTTFNLSGSTLTSTGYFYASTSATINSTGNTLLGGTGVQPYVNTDNTVLVASDNNSFCTGNPGCYAGLHPASISFVTQTKAQWLAIVCPANGNSVCVSPATQDAHSTFH